MAKRVYGKNYKRKKGLQLVANSKTFFFYSARLCSTGQQLLQLQDSLNKSSICFLLIFIHIHIVHEKKKYRKKLITLCFISERLSN